MTLIEVYPDNWVLGIFYKINTYIHQLSMAHFLFSLHEFQQTWNFASDLAYKSIGGIYILKTGNIHTLLCLIVGFGWKKCTKGKIISFS